MHSMLYTEVRAGHRVAFEDLALLMLLSRGR